MREAEAALAAKAIDLATKDAMEIARQAATAVAVMTENAEWPSSAAGEAAQCADEDEGADEGDDEGTDEGANQGQLRRDDVIDEVQVIQSAQQEIHEQEKPPYPWATDAQEDYEEKEDHEHTLESDHMYALHLELEERGYPALGSSIQPKMPMQQRSPLPEAHDLRLKLFASPQQHAQAGVSDVQAMPGASPINVPTKVAPGSVWATGGGVTAAQRIFKASAAGRSIRQPLIDQSEARSSWHNSHRHQHHVFIAPSPPQEQEHQKQGRYDPALQKKSTFQGFSPFALNRFARQLRQGGRPAEAEIMSNPFEGLTLHTNAIGVDEAAELAFWVETELTKGQRRLVREGKQSPNKTYMQATTTTRGRRRKGRQVMQFGVYYNFARHCVEPQTWVDPMPLQIQELVRKLLSRRVLPHFRTKRAHEKGPNYPPPQAALPGQRRTGDVHVMDVAPDSCIVNVYEPGDFIPPHIDHQDYPRPFSTLSLLSTAHMIFSENIQGTDDGGFAGEPGRSKNITLPERSVMVLDGNGADVVKHCLPPVSERRFSITLRKMPHWAALRLEK
jgi:alkylated DNA repair protein alkB family protein 5